MSLILGLLCGLFLAFANGANDNFKGVATLFGSHTTDYRKALLWGTVTTVLGSLMALIWAKGLVVTFSGKGLVPDAVISLKSFPLAVALAAGLTANLMTGMLVIAGSGAGLPLSTTHVSCGSLFGIGATTGRMQWNTLTSILLSWFITLPVAAALGYLAFFVLRGSV